MVNQQASNTQHAGFTLIEMLIVIAIIVILASILLVGGGIALRMMRRIQTEHRMDQIRAALDAYSEHFKTLGENLASAYDVPNYVQMLHIEEKSGNYLRVENGSWGPATYFTATHIRDGFDRPIWMQSLAREVANRPGKIYTAVIALRSCATKDDPDYSDDLILRFETDRCIWEKCSMSGVSATGAWILQVRK